MAIKIARYRVSLVCLLIYNRKLSEKAKRLQLDLFFHAYKKWTLENRLTHFTLNRWILIWRSIFILSRQILAVLLTTWLLGPKIGIARTTFYQKGLMVSRSALLTLFFYRFLTVKAIRTFWQKLVKKILY